MSIWLIVILIIAIVSIILSVYFFVIRKCKVAPPSNITAVYIPLDKNVLVSWIANPDADSYNVYMDTTSGFKTSSSNLISPNISETHTLVRIQNPGNYYFKVASVKKCVGNSAPSDGVLVTVCANPIGPSNVTAVLQPDGVTVAVNWVASIDNKVTGYFVYAGPKPNFNPLSGNFQVGDTAGTSYNVVLKNPQGLYYFKVASYSTNRDCISDAVPVQGVQIQFPSFSCPSILSPTNVQVNKNTISWNIVPNTNTYSIGGYNIYRDTDPNFTINLMGTGNDDKYIGGVIGASNTSFDLKNSLLKFVPGTIYYLKVTSLVDINGFNCNSIPSPSSGIMVRFS